MTGMVFVNGNGIAVIDDQFKNYTLRSQGTATSAADPASTRGRGRFQVTVNGDNPIIAFRSSNGVVMAARVQSGTSFTFYAYTEVAGQQVQYYVFDEPIVVSSTWGGQVFSAAGKLVFDALAKYMRVVDLVAIDVGSTGGTATKNYDGSKFYACAQMVPGLRWTAVSGPTGPGTPGQVITQHNKFAAFGQAGQGSATFSSLVTYSYSTNSQANAPDIDTGATQGLFLVLDVSNF